MTSHASDTDPQPSPPRLRFIPVRRADVLALLRLRHQQSSQWSAALDQRFAEGESRITEHFAQDFHGERQAIKNLYAPLDPDTDTRAIASTTEPANASKLSTELARILNRGNYEQLTQADLDRAFASASLFKIRLRVDMSDFAEVLLFGRGVTQREETTNALFGLLKQRVQFINYDRVVLFIRFAQHAKSDSGEALADRVMIKLFQNVPEADLEMLFPNTEVAMRLSDRLLIGIPALASGLVVAFTKLGAPLVLLGTLLGFWLGLHSQPVTLDNKGLIAIGAGFAALAGYIWKQLSNYRNRKARFRQALTRNLYFKLLDNNAGVLLRVLDDAEDSECKESWVALSFLLEHPEGIEESALDHAIERWFEQAIGAVIDFEIDDALAKLEQLGLATQHEGVWRPLHLDTGSEPAAPH